MRGNYLIWLNTDRIIIYDEIPTKPNQSRLFKHFRKSTQLLQTGSKTQVNKFYRHC